MLHSSSMFKQYIELMRLHKPIGILLLLWPTLWALWLASNGNPDPIILFIFIAGVVLMRSAGCIINDIADRKFDPYVARTRLRPLAANALSVRSASYLAIVLCLMAFTLVLFCNFFTLQLAFIGVLMVIIYPLLKRFTHLPQVGLGAAFSWGVPMAFAATRNRIDTDGWFLFITAVIWPVIYDTMYAMIDRDDDKKIGIKSAAILFAQMDRLILVLLQILFVTMMVIVGLMFHLHISFYLALCIVVGLFAYQQWLLSLSTANSYYLAFRNNTWVGLAIFLGIVFSYVYPVHIDAFLYGLKSEIEPHSIYVVDHDADTSKQRDGM